jgi:hypothetical protein
MTHVKHLTDCPAYHKHLITRYATSYEINEDGAFSSLELACGPEKAL